MRSDQSPEKKRSFNKATLYFILAFSSLLILAVVWSIDNSFIYCLTGLTIFFVFIGFSHHHFIHDKMESWNTAPPFHENIPAAISKKETPYEAKPDITVPRLRPTWFIAMGSLLLFFIALGILIFFRTDTDEGDAVYNLQQAESFYNDSAYDSAYLYYKRALALIPDNVEALTGYGNTFMMNNQYESAINFYNRALLMNPKYEKANYQKGAVLSYQKKFDASISVLKNLLAINPSYFDAMQLLGDDYYNKNKYDSAKLWYEDAYANGIRNRYLCHLLGYLYETNGNKAKAIGLYQEALSYDSSVLDIYQRIGELLPGDDGSFYRTKAATLEQEQK